MIYASGVMVEASLSNGNGLLSYCTGGAQQDKSQRIAVKSEWMGTPNRRRYVSYPIVGRGALAGSCNDTNLVSFLPCSLVPLVDLCLSKDGCTQPVACLRLAFKQPASIRRCIPHGGCTIYENL